MAKAKPSGKKASKKPPKRPATAGGSKIPPERLHLVERMLSACATRREIVHAVINGFGVSKQTAYSYYDLVVKEWRDEERPKRSYNRFLALKTLDRAITGAVADRKWSAVVRAVEAKAKLLGLNEPDEVVVVTRQEEDPIESMTSAQLRAYMEDERERGEALLASLAGETTTATTH